MRVMKSRHVKKQDFGNGVSAIQATSGSAGGTVFSRVGHELPFYLNRSIQGSGGTKFSTASMDPR